MKPGVLLTALLILAGSPGPAQSAVLRLRQKVMIAAPIVTLGDIAEILDNDTEAAKRLSGTELMPAPLAGESTWLDLVTLKDQLYRKGVSPATLQFVGLRRVQITRVAAAAEAPSSQSELSQGRRFWLDEITKMVRANVFQRTGWHEQDVRIEVRAERAAEILDAGRPPGWDLIVPPQWCLGSQRVILELPAVAGGSPSRLEFAVNIEREPRVVVARREIPRGADIQRADLETVRPTPGMSVEQFFGSTEELLGKKATCNLLPGRPIRRGDAKSIPLVFRNKQVTVLVHYRSAVIEMVAIAGEDGGLGDWIEAINPTTRKTLDNKVRVTGLQRAELPAQAPPSDQMAEAPFAQRAAGN